MPERTTVRLPEDLLRQAKRKAAAEGRTLTSLLEEGLRRVVTEKRLGNESRRVFPPVSSATGGLLPGIDLAKLSALEELEDVERAEAMKLGK